MSKIDHIPSAAHARVPTNFLGRIETLSCRSRNENVTRAHHNFRYCVPNSKPCARCRALCSSASCVYNPVFDICSSTRYATPISTASRTPNTNFQFIGQRPLPSLPRFAHHSATFIVSRPSKAATIAIPMIQKNVCMDAPRSAQPADFGTVAYNRARLLRVNQTAALRSRVSISIDMPSSVLVGLRSAIFFGSAANFVGSAACKQQKRAA